ncbi:phage tail tape measure protein [Candidatus Saccharibacteria bacterium]|nr:phage tail tape measure protein [Candidatus Saccharibacteria bacterium]
MADIKNNITTSFKADISQLKSGISEANRQIRLANAEFKAAASSLDFMANSADGIRAKLDQLNKVLNNQEKILDAYKKQLELTVKEQGDGSKAADDLRIKIANQQAAVNDTKKQIQDYDAKLEEAEKSMKDGAKAADNLGDAVDDAGDKAKSAGDGGFTVLKGAIADLVANAISKAVEALKDFAKEVVNVGMEFDTQMSKVKAISGATADEMTALRDKAKEMGESTKYTATEAGEAFEYMAMAGWKSSEMLNGIEGIMNLAAASGENLGTTSDIVTDALTAFGLSAKDAGHFADVLAAAATNSNTNVGMLGQSFKYVAPLAGAMSYSAEDIAVALGLMANAGIKADMAGTSLRNVLQRMAKPTKESANAMTELGLALYDENGKMYSLMEIMQQMRGAFSNIMIPIEEYDAAVAELDQQLADGTIKQKKYDEALEELNLRAFGAEGAEKARAAAMLGGARALAGLLAIANATEEDFDSLTASIYNCEGAAQTMADTMLDNLGGDMTILQSKLAGVKLALYEQLEPALRSGVEVLGKMVEVLKWIVDHSAAIAAGLKVIAAGVAAYVAYTTALKIMKDGFMSLTIVTKAVAAAQAVLNAVMAANPIGLIIAAIASLVAAFVILWNNCEEFREFWINLWENIKEVASIVGEAIAGFFANAWDAIKNAWSAAGDFFGGVWDSVKNAFANVGEWFSDVFTTAWENIKSAFANVGEWFKGVFEGAKNIIEKIWESVTEIVKAPINFLIRGLNKFIDQLNKIQIPDWVPGVGGYGLDIPRINELERGGVLKRGQIGFLEGNGAEAVVPLENNAAWINATAQAMKQALESEGIIAGAASAPAAGQGIVFNQYNNSPKALSRLDIYRATQNQLNFARGTI